MTISNLSKALSQLERWGEGFQTGALRAQVEVAEAVLERALIYVPVDTGALRASGRVNADLSNLEIAVAEVRFGSDVAPYAAIVHERLDLRHKPPTQAKYLERAAYELEPEMTLRIGEGAVAGAKNRSGAE